MEKLAQRSRRRHRQRLLGATLIALSTALFLTLRTNPASVPLVTPQTRSIALFEPETRTLPDGSHVELKRGTEMEIGFSAEIRRVKLRSGEAHFSVVKDAARPFIVEANGIEVRAVGTAFSVGLSSHDLAVLVTAGRVAVAQIDVVQAEGRTELTAGQRAVVRLDAHSQVEALSVSEMTSAQTSQHLAWRVSRLEFSATPLAEAIALFNQKAESRLVLDPTLADLRLSGSLRADDIEALLLLLREEFAVSAEPDATGQILLRRRSSGR